MRGHGEEMITLFLVFSIILCMGIKRLSHAVYDTRYHLVRAPKYRKWIVRDEVRDSAKELVEEILRARDS